MYTGICTSVWCHDGHTHTHSALNDRESANKEVRGEREANRESESREGGGGENRERQRVTLGEERDRTTWSGNKLKSVRLFADSLLTPEDLVTFSLTMLK